MKLATFNSVSLIIYTRAIETPENSTFQYQEIVMTVTKRGSSTTQFIYAKCYYKKICYSFVIIIRNRIVILAQSLRHY
jgi:hypothetical protein